MDRRQFSTAMAAAALAPGLAQANQHQNSNSHADEEGSDSGLPPFGHITLRSGSQVLIAARLIVVSDDFSQEIGLNFKFPMDNENRSSILTPTLARQFQNGTDIGDVFLAGGRTIIVKTGFGIPMTDLRVSNGEVSFRVNGDKLGKPYTGDVPVLSGLPQIGNLFRRRSDTRFKRNLLIFITPRILNYDA